MSAMHETTGFVTSDELGGLSLATDLPLDEVRRRLNRTRIFAFDLDGTVLTTEKTVTPRTLAALKALQERGIEPVPTTGRAWRGVCDETLGSDMFHYLVATCGQVVRDERTGEMLCHESIPGDVVLELVERLQKPGIVTYLNVDDDACTHMGTAVSAEEFERVTSYFSWKGLPRSDFDVLGALRRDRPRALKVGVRYMEPWSDEDLLAVGHELGLTANVCAPCNVEYNVPGASKAKGLGLLAERLGLGIENVCAIGDSGNDTEMLEETGLGVAMGNASEEARAAADVTIQLTNDEDGLADFVERALLR